MKLMFKISLLLLSIILLAGCGSTNRILNTPKGELFSDEKSSYIVFTRPDRFAAGGININVTEFTPTNLNDLKFVGNISNDESMIYKVKPGKHFFYIDPTDSIASIDIEKNEIKYVRLSLLPIFELSDRGSIYPIEIDSRLTIKEYIYKLGCNEKLKKSLLFQQKNEEVSNEYYSPTLFEIKCDNEQLVEVNDLLNDSTMNELKKVKIVESTDKSIEGFLKEKSSLISDLKEYYPLWNFKFKNMPLIQRPFLVIDKLSSNLEKQHYGKVNIVDGIHNKDMDVSSINEYILELRKNFKDNVSGKTLTLKISFSKYDDGNMAARYIMGGFGIDKESWGVIDFKVDLIDETGKTFNSFRIYETEMGGILGGINTLKPDTMKVLVDYIKLNFL